MKYDSSMTQYHGDIAKALLHYLKTDKNLEKLRSDGDAKPLRTYLKDKLGNSGFSSPSEPFRVWSSGSNLELIYEDQNEKLILSWSQLATLLRNDEFYAKYINTPPAPTEKAPLEAPETDDLRRARELSQRIQIAAELAQDNLWDMCCGLKEMRDTKLYKQLGYANFEDYCEREHSIKGSQARKYILVAEKYTGEQNRSPGNGFAQLGIKKLYLLSTLEEEQRAELVTTTDLKKTSAKELEEKIRDLKQQNEKLMDEVDLANKRAEKSDNERREAARKLSIVQTDAEGYLAKIKELEARPVEVATQIVEKIPDDYVTRQAYEEMVSNYTAQLDKADEEAIAEKRRAYEEKQQLEQKIAELENNPRENSEEVFGMLCQMCRHPLSKLALFVSDHPLYREKLQRFIEDNTKIIEEE